MTIGGDEVSLSPQARNLGVILDDDLSLSSHVMSICKAANYQLYRLSRIRKYLTPTALKTAVHTLVSSKLDYCNGLLVGLPKHQIDKLQMIMNSAARLITGTKKFEHITPVLIDLHWLPVDKRISFKVLCTTYKALNNLAPQYLMDQLENYTPGRALRSADKQLLSIPKIRTQKFGARSFKFAAPTLYNALPLEIRQSPTLDTFKSRLKTFFFKAAYGV